MQTSPFNLELALNGHPMVRNSAKSDRTHYIVGGFTQNSSKGLMLNISCMLDTGAVDHTFIEPVDTVKRGYVMLDTYIRRRELTLPEPIRELSRLRSVFYVNFPEKRIEQVDGILDKVLYSYDDGYFNYKLSDAMHDGLVFSTREAAEEFITALRG